MSTPAVPVPHTPECSPRELKTEELGYQLLRKSPER